MGELEGTVTGGDGAFQFPGAGPGDSPGPANALTFNFYSTYGNTSSGSRILPRGGGKEPYIFYLL